MWMCSSAFGIAQSSSGSRSRAILPKSIAGCALLLLAAGDLALDALDVEVDAAHELVVGVGAGGEHFLALVADDRALPDHEGAGLEPGLDALDLGLEVGRHLVGDRDDVDRPFLDAPPHAAAALPGACL